jgi:PAS domain S-box-containing protein
MKIIASLYHFNRGIRKGFFNLTNFPRLINKAAGTHAFIKSFLFLLIVLLVFCPHLFSQTRIDSLETSLSRFTGTYIEKIVLLNEISKSYWSVSPQKTIEYGKQALEISDELNYKKGLAHSLNNIGVGYYYLSDYNKALEYYLKSLKIQKEIGDKKGIARSLNNIGNIYYYFGNYNKALENFLKSLKLLEEIGDKESFSVTLNNVGNIYNKLKNYDKALQCYLKSLKIQKEIGYKKGLAGTLINSGNIYWNLKNFNKALESYKKALKIYEELDNKYGITNSLANIGNIYWEFRDYNEAVKYYQKSLKICKEIGNKIGITSSLINIGDTYTKLRKYDKAFLYIEQSLKLAEKIEAKDLIMHSYITFSELYSAKTDYQKALKYYKLYSTLKDSIFTKKNGDKIAEMQTKYETEKKEKENEILQKNNKIQNLEITRQRNLRNSFIAISGLILILVLVIYGRYRGKQKINKILTEKNLQITEQKNHLSTTLDELRKSQKLINQKSKQLKKSEKQYRTLFGSANDAIFLMRENCFIDCNPATEKMFGCPRDKIIGHYPYEFFPSRQPDGRESKEKALEKINSAFAGNHEYFEWVHCRADGFHLDMEVSLNRLEIDEEIMILAIVRDVTKRKLAEKKLRESEKRYRTLIEAITDIVYILDNNGRFTYINPKFENLAGYLIKDLIGSHFTKIIVPEYIESTIDRFKRGLKGERIPLYEIEIINKDGYKIPLELNVTSLFNADGEIIGMLGVARDITERKQAQKKLCNSERHSSLLENEIIDLHKKQTGERRILGKSGVMEKLFTVIEKVSKTDAAVLIYGETGTGKELIAHAIHSAGLRENKPFGIIDCASIPADLLESELFGYEKGSFTGAYNRKKGLFETSNGGTVILDEISELPLDLQPKLLRFLQEKNIRRIGGTKRIEVDVRVIAATNKDLITLVEAKRFRVDLYYRLNVIPVNIPPLRERGDDIILLAYYFLNQFGRNRGKKGFTNETKAALKSYHWPGNVRELQHKIERAVILSDSQYLTAGDLELVKQVENKKDNEIISLTDNLNQQDDFVINISMEENIPMKKMLSDFKIKVLDEAISICNGNVSKAAVMLGINRDTIYKIRQGN